MRAQALFLLLLLGATTGLQPSAPGSGRHRLSPRGGSLQKASLLQQSEKEAGEAPDAKEAAKHSLEEGEGEGTSDLENVTENFTENFTEEAKDGVEGDADGIEENREEENAFEHGWDFVVTTRTAVVVVLTIVILMSVLFEETRRLVHHLGNHVDPVLHALFAELTLLGFIGLVFFLIQKTTFLHDISVEIFGHEEGELLAELFEEVHMVVFLIMIIFLVMTFLLVACGFSAFSRWSRFDDHIAAGTSPGNKAAEFSTYSLLRRQFIAPVYPSAQDDPVNFPLDFNFAGYMQCAHTQAITSIVDVPCTTWLTLQLVFLCMWLVQTQIYTTWVTKAEVIFCGYFAMGLLLLMDWKTKKILRLLLPRPSDGDAPAYPAMYEQPLRNTRIPTIRHWLKTLFGETERSEEWEEENKPGSAEVGPMDALFWWHSLGSTFLFFTLRIAILTIAIYLSEIAFMLPQFLNAEHAVTQLVVAAIITILPLAVFGLLLPSVLARTTLVCNVEERKNMRVAYIMDQERRIGKALTALHLGISIQLYLQGKAPAGKSKFSQNSSKFVNMRGLLRSLFNMANEQGAGTLDSVTFGKLLSIFSLKMSAEKEQELFQSIESIEDGGITLDDLVSWELHQERRGCKLSTRGRMMFEAMDKTNVGELDCEAMLTTFNAMLPEESSVSMNEIHTVMATHDYSMNYLLGPSEFMELLEKHYPH